MRVVVRLVLPDPAALHALGWSAVGHLVLLAFVLVPTLMGEAAPPPPKVMTVRLTAAPVKARPAPAPQRRSTAKKPAPKKPEPKTEAPAEKPKRKKPRRTEAQAPKTVQTSPDETTARPDKLETAEAPPEPEPESTGSGTASDEPQAPLPGGVGGLETDEPFTADWYVLQVVSRLSEAWQDRPVLPAGSPTQRVVVGFTIHRDGRVTDIAVRVPSKYAPLDISARRAVLSLGRLPALPRSYDKSSLSARFVFELVPPDR